MSTKKPNSAVDGLEEEAAGAPPQEAEPVIVKDRRFWSKKAKDTAHEPNAAAAETAGADDTAPGTEPDPQVLALNETIQDLTTRLRDKEARLNATVAQYKEALDEFEGAKARLKRDVVKDVAQGKRAILVGLLDVIDNLERALSAAAPKEHDKDFLGFFEGVTMVRDQFLAKCNALGVSRAKSLGQPFDPLHFEAISTVPVTDASQHDRVVGVVREAYLMDGETLRHGIVAVGKHTP